MRKLIAIIMSLMLLASVSAGCAGTGSDQADSASEQTEISDIADDQADSASEQTEAGDSTSDQPETGSHYTFQTKVCSSYMTELFGETMRDTWFNLVDAVMAGEDHFDCPDSFTYDWVMGQFPEECFPVLIDLIDYCYDRDNPVVDGVASFVYKVPPEEAATRIAEFAEMVETILNDNLEDDYSDFEKALALYIYFSHTYEYDYEAADPDVYRDDLSGLRLLTTGKGICGEISTAYSYLLLQAGVDASTMSASRSYDMEPHQWSYVRINGHNFHIDPTYVISNQDALSYFMMDDTQREAEDGYLRDDYIICSNYAQDHPHLDYVADDDSFSDIWMGYYTGFDHETRMLFYEISSGDDPPSQYGFDYTGW